MKAGGLEGWTSPSGHFNSDHLSASPGWVCGAVIVAPARTIPDTEPPHTTAQPQQTTAAQHRQRQNRSRAPVGRTRGSQGEIVTSN